MNRPDFSNLLVHFTSDRDPFSKADDNPCNQFIGKNAYEKIISILHDKKIVASNMPWSGRHAACFTECPWSSLIDHANRYSSFGIGFSKPFIFGAGGGPVYYVRADHYKKQNWDNHLLTFVTPFWPAYRPGNLRTDEFLEGKDADYSHEREWRVPHDLVFEYDQITCVILNNYDDMAKFDKNLKDSIGREKFILMDQYKKIETLWPVHKI
jgi:hypothetical protein